MRDGGTFARATAQLEDGQLSLDLVFDPGTDIEAPESIEGILVESLADMRANKFTCILSRSEPRDLVDLWFLERAGYPPDNDLAIALQKDRGIDPGIIAWLLGQFPVSPLPIMVVPITEHQLRSFRDDLRERFRRLSVPAE